MNSLSQESKFISLSEMRLTKGSLRHINQPCQIAILKIDKSFEFAPDDLISAVSFMIRDEQYFVQWREFQTKWNGWSSSESARSSLAHLLLWWWLQELKLLTRSNSRGSVRQLKMGYFELAIPNLINPSEAAVLLTMIIDSCNQLLRLPSDENLMRSVALLRSQWQQQRMSRKWTKVSWNTAMFRDAADRNSIPWWTLKSGADQFGWGCKGRRLISSHSDQTNVLSKMLAKHKGLMNEFLRAAGLPVARQSLATSAEKCVELARQIGYPVVVKPAMEDFARGVSVNLHCDEDVIAAFGRAQGMGPVLVESHVRGREYRITVVNGRVTCAYERVGPTVVGDGVHTIAELIHALNSSPDRHGFPHSLCPVPINNEISEVLASQGWTLDSVPPLQSVVRLLDIPLIVNGGSPENRLDTIHSDNIDAIIRATRIIGLDIAGVDFIIPDISKSWLECECAILEVNSQPLLIADQISGTAPDYFGDLLKTLLNGSDGRLPVVSLIGDAVASEAAQLAKNLLLQQGYHGVGIATEHGACLDNERLSLADVSGVNARDVLLIDPLLQFALIQCKLLKTLHEGHPCDRYSITVILESRQAKVDLPEKVRITAMAEFIQRTTDCVAINIDDALLRRVAIQVHSKKLVLLSTNPGIDMTNGELPKSCPVFVHGGDIIRLYQNGKENPIKVEEPLFSADPMSLLGALAIRLAFGSHLSKELE